MTRDRALLLLGFSGAFRCSELVALNVESLRFDVAGVSAFVARSREDELARGATTHIPCVARVAVRQLRCDRSALLVASTTASRRALGYFPRLPARDFANSRLRSDASIRARSRGRITLSRRGRARTYDECRTT